MRWRNEDIPGEQDDQQDEVPSTVDNHSGEEDGTGQEGIGGDQDPFAEWKEDSEDEEQGRAYPCKDRTEQDRIAKTPDRKSQYPGTVG